MLTEITLVMSILGFIRSVPLARKFWCVGGGSKKGVHHPYRPITEGATPHIWYAWSEYLLYVVGSADTWANATQYKQNL